MSRTQDQITQLQRQVAGLASEAKEGKRLTSLATASFARLHGLPAGIQELLRADSATAGTPVVGANPQTSGMQYKVGELVLTVYPYAGKYGQFTIADNSGTLEKQTFDFTDPSEPTPDLHPSVALMVIGLGTVAADPSRAAGSAYLSDTMAQLRAA